MTKSEDPAIDTVKAELVAALLEDESRLGEVYRLLREGLSAEEMADRMGIATPGLTSSYEKQLAAILDGRLPTNSHLAQHAADRLRRWKRQKTWTPPAHQHLESLLSGLETIATDVNLAELERHEAAKRTSAAERLGLTGIYVYTMPHYLRYPWDPETGRTFFKVGHSTMDVFSDASAERSLPMPEDPILMRVYVTGDKPADAEEQHFREWMEAAGHVRGRAHGNREWYVTTMKFLDRVAMQRGLDITVVSDLDSDA